MTRLSSRRDFIRGLFGGAAGLSVLILASCGGSSSSQSTASNASTTATTTTGPPAAASTAEPTPTMAMSMQMSPDATPPSSPSVASGSISPVASPSAAPSAATTAAPTAGVEVKIVEPSTNFNTWGYHPKTITVKVGTTVTWINTGGATHTVTADSKAFDSGSIAPSKHYSLKTTTTGTFNYHCAFHPWMKGTLTVTK